VIDMKFWNSERAWARGYFAGTHQAIHWTHNGGAVVSFTVLFDDD
jgi:hypothetical protein